jgi:hypothetical protein
MPRTLLPAERLAITAAQHAVRQIADNAPACLSGEQLVASLLSLLECMGDRNNLTSVGLAAAGIAAFIESERAQANDERSTAA